MIKQEVLERLNNIAKKLRINVLKMTTKAGSGHPTTCMSMAEIMSVLFFNEMKYNPRNANELGNDDFVLSKGHAAPILWAAYAEAGIIKEKKLIKLRRINSELEGHPTPRMEWVKVATGSLGQGLGAGVGMALGNKLLKLRNRVYVVLGDGECAEGSVWEAANTAAYYKLNNLVAIVDVNRLGQSQETMHGHKISNYVNKFEAFGWNVVSVNGHNVKDLINVFRRARNSSKPVVIIAKTFKGKGVSFLENKEGWHGKVLNKEELKKALEEIGEVPKVNAKKLIKIPKKVKRRLRKGDFRIGLYKDGVATREAYGNALLKLGKVNEAVVAVDGDVKNSTKAEEFFKSYRKRGFDSFIAEQNMVGMAIGLSAKGFIPFVATFSAFLTRAHDFIRMAGYSNSNIKFVGSHSGISIGEDGPSQMGLEDIAMFRSIINSIVLNPSDPYSTEYCVKEMAKVKCLCYLRTNRPKTPVLYKQTDKFPIGKSKVLRKSSNDKVTVISSGVTVHETLKAYEILRKKRINIRVIDAYSIKPLDKNGILRNVNETDGKAVVVEDHFEEGGLGEAVKSVLNNVDVIHLCVRKIPRSGTFEQLYDKYGISAKHIVNAVKKLKRSRKINKEKN